MCGVKLTSPPFNGVSGGCGGRGQLANSLRFSAAARPMQVLKLLAPLAHAGAARFHGTACKQTSTVMQGRTGSLGTNYRPDIRQFELSKKLQCERPGPISDKVCGYVAGRGVRVQGKNPVHWLPKNAFQRSWRCDSRQPHRLCRHKRPGAADTPWRDKPRLGEGLKAAGCL